MRYALLFQGQGKYKTRYAHSLYEKSQIVKRIFQEAEDILGTKVGELLFQVNDFGDLDTQQAQVMIFLTEYSIYKHFQEQYSIQPTIVAGHSLGEITALTVAQAIDFEDAIKLVNQRGRLMQTYRGSRLQGMMAVSNVSSEVIEHICKQVDESDKECVVCANYNSKDQIVISGYMDSLEKVQEKLSDYKTHFLKVKGAFHSPLMEDSARELKSYIDANVLFSPLKIPVISSSTSQLYPGSYAIPFMLSNQLIRPVLWSQVIDNIEKEGVAIFAQVTDSKLFMSLNRSLVFNHIWTSLEGICNDLDVTDEEQKEIYDYSKLYHSRQKLFCNQIPIIGEVLTYFVAFPWKQNCAKKLIEDAKVQYKRIMEVYLNLLQEQKESNLQQIQEYIKILTNVLQSKDTGELTVHSIVNSILNKYGLAGLI